MSLQHFFKITKQVILFILFAGHGEHYKYVFMMSEGAKLVTLNFKWDNLDIPKFNGAKPYIINKNETNLTPPLSRGKQTLV